MKQAAILLLTAVLIAATAGDALAQFGQRRNGGEGRGGPPDRQQPDRRQESRPQPPQQPPQGNRMSPEERQQLREQIRDHGYRNPDRPKRQ